MSLPVNNNHLTRLFTRYDFTDAKGQPVSPKIRIEADCPINVIQTDEGEPALAVMTSACEQDHISITPSQDGVDINVVIPENWNSADNKEQRARMGELTITLGSNADSLIVRTGRDGVPVSIDALADSISVVALNRSKISVTGKIMFFYGRFKNDCTLNMTGDILQGIINAENGNMITSAADIRTLQLSTTSAVSSDKVNVFDITKAKYTKLLVGGEDTMQATFTLGGQTMGVHITPQTLTMQHVVGCELDHFRAAPLINEETVYAKYNDEAATFIVERAENRKVTPRQIDHVAIAFPAIRHG